MATTLHRGLDFVQTIVRHPAGYEIILYRHDGMVHAYRNSCPHVGVGLDYGDGRCLADDGVTLYCALHGATFEGDTGACTGGPCYGKGLERIAIRVVDGDIVVD